MKTAASFSFLVLALSQSPALGASRKEFHEHFPTLPATISSTIRREQHLRKPTLLLSNVSGRKSGRRLAQCSAGEMFVEIDLVTDQNPQETSWGLYDSAGNTVSSWQYGDHGFDNMQPNEGWLETVGCIPEDACYTFSVFDSAGDGMVSSDHDLYHDGGYWVYVNSDQTFSVGVVVESGDAAFGSSVSHTFGNCDDVPDEAAIEECPMGTLPVTLDFVTEDASGDDVSLYLVDLATETFLWNDRGLDNSTEYHYFACLDVSSCANLVLSNHGQSNVTVTYNGDVIYDADEQDDDGSTTVVACNC